MLNTILRTPVLIAATLCACSSISRKQALESFPFPPSVTTVQSGLANPVTIDHELEKALRANPSEEMRFLTRYRQAKLWQATDAAKSCALWLDITDNPRFPLANVARLRAIETCPVERLEITPFLQQIAGSSADPWLREATLRAGLTRATRTSDRALEMRLSLEILPFVSAQAEQLKLIERARTLAAELGDTATTLVAELQLKKSAPRLNLDPQPEQYMTVAADFRRARDYERAREYYKKIIDGPSFSDSERLRALDGIRMTFKLASQREKYIEATHDYSNFARAKFFITHAGKNLARYLDTRLTLARAIWTENSAREAETLLKKVERELRGKHPVEESIFLRARIEEERGNLDKTVRLLDSINESRISDRATRQKVVWHRAWTYRKIGRAKDATKLFERLVSEEDYPPLIARNRYWLGRTLKETGEAEKSLQEFNWLVTNDPIGYYGTLAFRELNQPMPSLAVADAAERLPANASPPVTSAGAESTRALFNEERLIFEWLMATSELDLGRRFLDQLSSDRRASLSEEQLIDYLQLYARAGAYLSLFSRLSELTPEMRRQILDKKPELIFPRPWQAAIERAAEKFSVKPQLVFSIIRQESSFNPLARSPADAFGLMQLIPEVAKETALTAGVSYNSFEDLYDPEANIALGTAHLRDLFRRWDDRFIPAVASYNASERAVSGWLRTRDRRDPVQFIEDIPYEETKGYVKLVLRNYIFYSRLSSGGAPVPFPEWCLAGIQDIKL